MLQPTQIPLSLYIHMPWCVRKCPYCDFNSHQASEIPEQQYLDCLIQDLQDEVSQVQGRALHSIFIGGGTPSLISPEGIHRIVSEVKRQLYCDADLEVTMEANPGTMEAGRFAGYFQAGVNRLSIGVQSFDDRQLQRLGRIHSAGQAQAAVDIARNAGFQRINLDLMHGLPDQTVDEALADLQQAIALATDHLSWYQLTIEPNTIFYSKPPLLPEDDLLWQIQQAGQALLQQSGFLQYEISAYARQETDRCRHNLNYWSFGDYLAIGAGAHGKLTTSDAIRRYHKKRIPKDYMHPDKPFLAQQHVVTSDEYLFEFMMNCLRLVDGVPAEWLQQRTGIEWSSIQETIQPLCQQGLLREDNSRIQISAEGMHFLNDVLQHFL